MWWGTRWDIQSDGHEMEMESQRGQLAGLILTSLPCCGAGLEGCSCLSPASTRSRPPPVLPKTSRR